LVWGSHLPGGAQVALLDSSGFIDEDKTSGRNTVNGPDKDAVGYKTVAQTSPQGEEGTGEAPAILPYTCGGNNYYYLFWTWGACCRGSSSTYETVMGRSESPFGPYKDKSGIDMASYSGTIGIAGGTYFMKNAVATSDSDPAALGTRYVGPGHIAFFEYTENGQKKMVGTFHFYDATRAGSAYLGAREVLFSSDCWPYLEDTTWRASSYF